MKNLFVPYEIALLAKEKGFDEPCLSKYSTTKKMDIASTFGITNSMLAENVDYKKYGWICAAPLYQQLTTWFIGEGYFITVFPITKNTYCYAIEFMRTMPDSYSFTDYYESTNTKQIIDQIIEEEKLKGWEKLTIEVQQKLNLSMQQAYDKAFEESFKLI